MAWAVVLEFWQELAAELLTVLAPMLPAERSPHVPMRDSAWRPLRAECASVKRTRFTD